jgi:RNA polymerase sigma factor (TIGR02999 family)
MSEPFPPESPMSNGEPVDGARLFEALLAELRRVAGCIGAGEIGRTLHPTALVNEAYLRLMGGRPRSWADRQHFLRSAAATMRNLLISHRRRRPLTQWCPEAERALDALVAGMEQRCGGDLLAVQDALEQLREVDDEAAEYVQLRFFGGQTNLQAAATLGIGERTGERHWVFARSWLQTRLAR